LGQSSCPTCTVIIDKDIREQRCKQRWDLSYVIAISLRGAIISRPKTFLAHLIPKTGGIDPSPVENPVIDPIPRAWLFSRAVLQQYLAAGLVDRAFAISIDPQIANDNYVPLQSEALEIGLDLEVAPVFFI
jgi:hypothetical protein